MDFEVKLSKSRKINFISIYAPPLSFVIIRVTGEIFEVISFQSSIINGGDFNAQSENSTDSQFNNHFN